MAFKYEQLSKELQERIRRDNPTAFGLGAMAAREPERGVRPALESPRPKRQKGKGGVEIVVGLVTCCRREADDDNNIASLKPLRDAIAESLCIDDGDKIVRFEYSQIETRGQTGVIVTIQNP